MKVSRPKGRQAGDVIGFRQRCVNSAINHPGDRGGIAEIGGQFRMGVRQKFVLTGNPADIGGQVGIGDQIFVPNAGVCIGGDLINAQAAAALVSQMEAQTGLLSGGAQ